jgi:hypothetical protein
MSPTSSTHFLVFDQFVVRSLLSQQFVVLSHFDDGAIGKNGDFIGALDGA